MYVFVYTKRISVVIEWESEDMEYNEDYDAEDGERNEIFTEYL